jgi:hypothetical protein
VIPCNRSVSVLPAVALFCPHTEQLSSYTLLHVNTLCASHGATHILQADFHRPQPSQHCTCPSRPHSALDVHDSPSDRSVFDTSPRSALSTLHNTPRASQTSDSEVRRGLHHIGCKSTYPLAGAHLVL